MFRTKGNLLQENYSGKCTTSVFGTGLRGLWKLSLLSSSDTATFILASEKLYMFQKMGNAQRNSAAGIESSPF
jgi:hypothetical protein